MKERKYQLVLFDLDGVLIDTKRNMEVSWSAVQAGFEIDSSFDEYFASIGVPFEIIMADLGLSDLMPGIKKVYDVTSSCRTDLINVFPGCADLVNSLRRAGMRTGIVTSKDEVRTLEIVKKLEMVFDVIECPDGLVRGKPNPDPLLRALLRCQMDPGDVVYVGDMGVDEEAARRASLDYVHAGWGYGECSMEAIRADKPEAILNLVS